MESVRAVREAVGDEIDIAVDYSGRSFSPSEAIKLANALEPYGIFFFEEPALSENPEFLLEAKAKTKIPIAAGERCVHPQNMRDLIEKRAVHIIQPEPTANGGIFQTVKLAGMAELYHIMVAPHQACSPVSLLINGHIDASIPNFLIQECSVMPDMDLARDVFNNVPRIDHGYLELPDQPGLGIELKEDAVKDHIYEPWDRRYHSA